MRSGQQQAVQHGHLGWHAVVGLAQVQDHGEPPVGAVQLAHVMGRNRLETHDAGMKPVRAVRLALEDIKPRAAETPAAQGLQKGAVIDQPAPRQPVAA